MVEEWYNRTYWACGRTINQEEKHFENRKKSIESKEFADKEEK